MDFDDIQYGVQLKEPVRDEGPQSEEPAVENILPKLLSEISTLQEEIMRLKSDFANFKSPEPAMKSWDDDPQETVSLAPEESFNEGTPLSPADEGEDLAVFPEELYTRELTEEPEASSEEVPEVPVTPTEEPADLTGEPDMAPELIKDIKTILAYMDTLLENLPEEKITEFANSAYFETYKNLFMKLGLA
jgi:hypothetical protein